MQSDHRQRTPHPSGIWGVEGVLGRWGLLLRPVVHLAPTTPLSRSLGNIACADDQTVVLTKALAEPPLLRLNKGQTCRLC